MHRPDLLDLPDARHGEPPSTHEAVPRPTNGGGTAANDTGHPRPRVERDTRSEVVDHDVGDAV